MLPPSRIAPVSLEPILNAAAMRAADAHAIAAGLPGRVLMENAGRAVTAAIEANFEPLEGSEIVVLCGTGNNGGDGYVVARALVEHGARVRVATAGAPATDDAAANLAALRALAGDAVTVHEAAGARALAGARPALIVDALLGTGQAPAGAGESWLREPVRTLAVWANRQSAPVVAVDLPTGVDADTGAADAAAVRATLTVALGALKPGLLLAAGADLAGEVTVADIGIPRSVLKAGATAWRATDAWVAERLPARPVGAHKYAVGRVLAVVGSRDYTGAAALATGAAYRTGAGAVTCCTPRSAQPAIDALRAEVMVRPQFETEEGTLAIAAYDDIVESLGAADAVVLGCGLGRVAETQRLLKALMRRTYVPTVVDADGLNAFAGAAEKLADIHGALVLTPHAGELERLTGEPLGPDRLATVRERASRWNAVVVLKGMPSVVGAPDGRTFVGPAPAPALATAGSGDVLAGTIAGLLARGMEPAEAAVAALHIGTAAAERFGQTRGPGMVASDLLDHIPDVLADRFTSG